MHWNEDIYSFKIYYFIFLLTTQVSYLAIKKCSYIELMLQHIN